MIINYIYLIMYIVPMYKKMIIDWKIFSDKINLMSLKLNLKAQPYFVHII